MDPRNERGQMYRVFPSQRSMLESANESKGHRPTLEERPTSRVFMHFIALKTTCSKMAILASDLPPVSTHTTELSIRLSRYWRTGSGGMVS